MENKRSEIVKLLVKTNAAMGGRELGREFCEMAARKCEKWGLEVMRLALDKWVEKNKFMPKISELIEQCKFWDEYTGKAGKHSPSEGICRYNNPGEHALSRSLCQRKDIPPDEARHTQAQFGLVMCSWHAQCSYAKLFPESPTAIFVKQHLKNLAKFNNEGKNHDQNTPKNDQEGISGSVFNKINT